MFAYCNNTPVGVSDIRGNRPESCVVVCDGGSYHDNYDYTESICDDLCDGIKSVKDSLSNYSLLFGISGRAACGVSGNLSTYLSADFKGNVALYVSYGLGGGFPSASASVYGGFISTPDARYLGGLGLATGGSIGEVFGVGGDYVIAIDDERNTTYHGATVGVKTIIEVPVPVEMHCDGSNSNMIYSFNIFDFASSVWEAIKSVF